MLDHITDSLPNASTGFCEPLAQDYFRSLRAILENAPHTEHLRNAKWHGLLNFILASLSEVSQDDDANQGESFGTPQPEPKSSDGQTVSMLLTSRYSARMAHQSKASYAEDLVSSLSALMNHTNIPIASQASVIGDHMVSLLRESSSASGTQHRAFCVLNKLLAVLTTENRKAFGVLIKDCFLLLRRLWSSKSTLLKDEMVVTLVFVQEFLRYDATGHDTSPLQDETDALFEVMYNDYSRRQEKELLHSEEVRFHRSTLLTSCHIGSLEPDLQNSGTITKWMTISVMATLLVHSSIGRQSHIPSPLDEDQPSKRRRLTPGIQDFCARAITGSTTERITVLQLLLFALHEAKYLERDLRSFATQILSTTGVEDVETVSWIFLAYSR